MAEITFKNDKLEKRLDPLEAGTYPARCFAIVLSGTVHNQTYDKDVTYINFGFEIPSESVKVGGDVTPRSIWARYTWPGTHEKASLRKMLEQWRGKAFTDDEIRKGFPFSKILGTPCILNLTADPTPSGDVYNHISSVSKLMKGMTVDVPIQEQVMFNILADDEDLHNMEKLPPFIQNRIVESFEYKKRTGQIPAEVTDEEAFAPIAAPEEDLPF